MKIDLKNIDSDAFDDTMYPKIAIIDNKVWRQEIDCGRSVEDGSPIWVKFM